MFGATRRSGFASFAKLLFLGALMIQGLMASVFVSTDDNRFGTIDVTTGVFTQIGGVGASTLWGLAESGGVIYAVDGSSNLLSVDPNTGSATTIGATGASDLIALGGLTTGALYAIDASSNLFSINPITAAATLIGPTGVPTTGPNPFAFAITGDATTLYVSETIFNNVLPTTLYAVNPANGNTTTIGQVTPTLSITGMGFVGGSLYAFSQDSGKPFATVNTTTAASTAAGTTSPTIVGVLEVNSVPEPDARTLSMIGLGLLGIGRWFRRSRRA